ncbi:DUF6456 domain-containing protein [Novosphingopyxis sp.]|uniref:DUF6456 domain-containing protein n=1 Tax=Novosphingopyxis sp. TaxID=2709690 RepID=UPI003B591BF5
MPSKSRAIHADPRPLAERGLPGGRRLAGGRPARSVTVNQAESPLGWLRARGHLDDRQFDAGEKLRFDYERGAIGPRVTMGWNPAPRARGRRGPAEHFEPTEVQIAAKRRFDGALEALGGGLADIAWRVICDGQSVPGAERGLGWPARSGKLVLRIALDRLAEFYRLPG